MGSALKAQPGQMGSPFVVQDNPLSDMDPSPEVGTSACQPLFAQLLADDDQWCWLRLQASVMAISPRGPDLPARARMQLAYTVDAGPME